jgi:hypothetical protein
MSMSVYNLHEAKVMFFEAAWSKEQGAWGKTKDKSESTENKLLNIRGTDTGNSCQTFRLQTLRPLIPQDPYFASCISS